jgi:hypothetical protein
MIQTVTGKLGMGKTLYTVMLMFDALCLGRTVVTNIDVVWPEMVRLAMRLKGVVLDPAQLVKLDPEKDKNWQGKIPWGSRTHPVEVFLDEIHLFYNARDWQTTGVNNRGLLSFLTQSRKACVNVTLIAQEKETVEKQFRALAEWELAIVSSSHIPLGILQMLPWKCFIVRVKDADKGHLIKRIWRAYDKRFFKCYRTEAFLDSEMQDLAAKVERVEGYKLQRVALWRRWRMDMAEPFRPLLAWLDRKQFRLFHRPAKVWAWPGQEKSHFGPGIDAAAEIAYMDANPDKFPK